MIALCEYILEGDKGCEQAAIKGGHYCRHHQVIRKSVAAVEAEGLEEREPLPLVFPKDHASQLFNYFLVLQALNEGRLNSKMANIMIRLLKACDANLKNARLNEGANSDSESNSEQDTEAVEGEKISVAAAGEDCALPPFAQNHPTDEDLSVHPRERRPVHGDPGVGTPVVREGWGTQQKREPLDLLRHSRGMRGRSRRRG